LPRSSRAHTEAVQIGRLTIGGGAPVAVQSMTKTRTEDVQATVRQIRRLERAGCEIVRCAVPTLEATQALAEIKARTRLPLVADIHFDYRLALASIRAGADKVRINPGNIGARWKTEEVIRAAADAGIAIRVGVNSGSLPAAVVARYGEPSVEAMLSATHDALGPFDRLDFRALVLSAKASGVPETIHVYRELAARYRYPLHLGLTEAGLEFEGAIRSAAALGVLLSDGIGDTIRVSLTADPVREVQAGFELLQALRLREWGPELISCPTCGRCRVDLAGIARRIKKGLDKLPRGRRIGVAVMGCTVNGPGEARVADYGAACGRGSGLLFEQGRVLRKCPERNLVEELLTAITGDRSPE
jgi:(E)-4-hydroxy-3-methylbut-2-enyl-diphosphate synthase